MPWLTEHWRALSSGGGLAVVLLVLWRNGFIRWCFNCCRALQKAYRDEVRADALKARDDCSEQLAQVKSTLRGRVLTDDARDEIHAQDLAEKKQMAACIARLKQRLTENRVAFDDLL